MAFSKHWIGTLVFKARGALCRWLPKGTFKSRDLQMKSIIPQNTDITSKFIQVCYYKVINNNNLPLQRGSRVPNLLVLFPKKERNFTTDKYNIRILFPGSRCSFAQNPKMICSREDSLIIF